VPRSLSFGDIYFSPQDGIAESLHHYIHGNRLAERFSSCQKGFTIAEIGFGTGLNFLLTCQYWQRYVRQTKAAPYDDENLSNSQGNVLHYISVEKHPIKIQQFKHIHQKNGWQNAFSQALIAHYPPMQQGCYTFDIRGGKSAIKLTLLFGEASEMLRAFPFIANAWFLDGFAPRLNPDAWSQTLCHQVASHSRRGSTFSTFTAASRVRKNLITSGFIVDKASGYGRKREHLLGSYCAPC